MELIIKGSRTHLSIKKYFIEYFKMLAFISLKYLNQWNQADETTKQILCFCKIKPRLFSKTNLKNATGFSI